MVVIHRWGLGFSGVGWLGESLIQALEVAPSLHLAGVQDADASLVHAVATRHGSPWQGTDYESLLAAPGVDAVVISTPNVLHLSQSIDALQAGKHVLVQKPLAFSGADALTASATAKEAGKLLFVDYSYSFLSTMQTLRTCRAQIGSIRRIRAAFHNIYGPGKRWCFDPRLSGGGALIDLGVHLLKLAFELQEPTSIRLKRSQLDFQQQHLVEDAAHLVLELDGVPFELDVSWNAERSASQIELDVEGTEGHARWENVDGSFFRFRTLLDGQCLDEVETPLRTDTLQAFERSLTGGHWRSNVDARIYDVISTAYADAPWKVSRLTQ